jgi:hypothetical protein
LKPVINLAFLLIFPSSPPPWLLISWLYIPLCVLRVHWIVTI